MGFTKMFLGLMAVVLLANGCAVQNSSEKTNDMPSSVNIKSQSKSSSPIVAIYRGPAGCKLKYYAIIEYI